MDEIHLVTGASSGVGRALCMDLAQRGLKVLGIARRAPQLEALKKLYPDKIEILAADLGDPMAWQNVADRVRDRHRVSSLTHSAAVATNGYLKDMSLDTYRKIVAINLEAPIFLTQALLPHFRRGARILHLSSGAAYRAIEYGGVYSITKAALLMAYRAWNADFPNGEIIAGSARPGVVDGPMQDAARSGDYPGVELFRGFKEQGMLIQPSRVAAFLAWLLLGTGDKEFASQDWNILDESHHPHWLNGALTG